MRGAIGFYGLVGWRALEAHYGGCMRKDWISLVSEYFLGQAFLG